MSCQVKESVFDTSEDKFYKTLEQHIDQLKFSEECKDFFKFILMRNQLETLPTFHDLLQEMKAEERSQDSTFLGRIVKAKEFNFSIDMKEFFLKKNTSVTSLNSIDTKED